MRQAEENAKKSANQENVAETAPQIPKLPEETSENVSARVERNPRNEEEKYKSAISFALGENEDKNSEVNELKTNAPTQKKL